jgi:perosamine synthetase
VKNKIYPVSKPLVTNQDIKSINSVLKKSWISSDGPEVKKFEIQFSKYVNQKFSIAVSNGTAALEIALKALGIKKNDQVIIPDFTIISNALAVIKLEATPIFIDCNLDDWNMNINLIEKKINKNTKAIIITHIYSFSNDMKKILELCKKYNLFLIEDAAEVIGLKYKNQMCGSFGDVSTFSFYANKHITTGEGGMISTSNKKIYEKCKDLRNLCFGKKDRFNHTDIGWNYRMTNIQAAMGLTQLKNINRVIYKKKQIGLDYYNILSKNNKLQILPASNYNSENIYWIVGILIKNKLMTASALAKKLLKYGIMTRPFFYPMHSQKILKNFKSNFNDNFYNSSYLGKYGLYLPSYFELKKNDIIKICKKINNILKCLLIKIFLQKLRLFFF